MPGGVRSYESVYRGESPMLMQEPWAKVREFYRRCGLKLENPAHHPDDHAAVELSFMVYLIEEGDTEAEQAAFFKQHLAGWIPQLFIEMMQHQQSHFYKDVAAYGHSFIENEGLRFTCDIQEGRKSPEQKQGSET